MLNREALAAMYQALGHMFEDKPELEQAYQLGRSIQ